MGMSFLDLSFIFYVFPIAVIVAVFISYVKNSKIRKTIITLLSFSILFFYSRDLLLLFITFILGSYLLGHLVFATKNSQTISKKWMTISVSIFVFILAYIKYVPALLKWWNHFNVFTIGYKKFAVLSGISFIIFEAISYIVDIYRGDAKPGSLVDYLLFISFFPKLISGPIVKWKDFQPQIVERKTGVDCVSSGLTKVIIGYSKKLIIADTLGAHIGYIQSMTSKGADALTYWLIALLYFFEIYYDFSGYSDIAIGFSEMLGISIRPNFDHPYASLSITEFWRRWHVSLGDWFKEYVYIPLGGNRTGNVYVNLFIVFLLTGIWHGANLTFLIWGVAHGLVIVVERAIRNKNWYKRVPSLVKWLCTTLFVFMAWIPFMSPNLKETGLFYKRMFVFSSKLVNFTWRFFLTRKILIILVIAAVLAILGRFKWSEKISKHMQKTYFVWIKYVFLIGLLVLSILFIVNASYSPFIYMQF